VRAVVNINVNMIPWAITRAGFNLHEISESIPYILDWIKGDKKPTVRQLEDFSKKVYLPFGYFFLAEPPKEKLPIPYFRTNINQNQQVSINIYDTILIMQQRQDWLREYLTELDYHKLPFVGKFHNSNNIKEIVYDIRSTLGLTEDWAKQSKTWQEALENLIQHIEDIGIIAVFNGVVENNTHRPLSVEECRGFVLVDELAPLMFINNSDSKSAQIFTIVHELAHVWTGYSAGFDFRKLEPADNPIELLCDKIAAEFLVPEIEFNRIWTKYASIKIASRFFKVSEIVIARRALDLGKITKKEFYTFYDEYTNREFVKKESQSGGNFYATTKKRLGIAFAVHINNAVKSGKLLFRDAYKLTSLKGDTFQKFFSEHF
jgi:Zn-dependent peptidase ImmA (M78 family)